MPDDSASCGRCGSVREHGRWVRRAGRPGAGAPAGGDPHAGVDRGARAPGAGPAWTAPAGRTGSAGDEGRAGGGARWGCLAGGLAVGLVALLAVVGLLLAGAGSRSAGDGPGPTWSPGYAATFESACGATGVGASYCRCVRSGLEVRIPEADMVRFQRKLAAGASLDAADRRTFREVESRCGS